MNYEDKIIAWKNNLLGEDKIDVSLCETLAQKILSVESNILELGLSTYDKTPSNTITGRHIYYNLLDYDWDELEMIKRKIIENSSKIIGGNSFYVKMWANIFRTGEDIKKHTHHAEPYVETEDFKKGIFSTICGHLFIKNDVQSDTIYHFTNNVQPIKNIKGDMHFFSCIVPHEVLPYKGKERISIAFDVYTHDFFNKLGITPMKELRIIK